MEVLQPRQGSWKCVLVNLKSVLVQLVAYWKRFLNAIYSDLILLTLGKISSNYRQISFNISTIIYRHEFVI